MFLGRITSMKLLLAIILTLDFPKILNILEFTEYFMFQLIEELKQILWSKGLSRPFRPAKPAVFGILGVNQTQIPSVQSLPFSELVPIRHTHSQETHQYKEVYICIRDIHRYLRTGIPLNMASFVCIRDQPSTKKLQTRNIGCSRKNATQIL